MSWFDDDVLVVPPPQRPTTRWTGKTSYDNNNDTFKYQQIVWHTVLHERFIYVSSSDEPGESWVVTLPGVEGDICTSTLSVQTAFLEPVVLSSGKRKFWGGWKL